MVLKPLRNMLLVLPTTEETTPGGLVLATSSRAQLAKGQVIAIGPGLYHNGQLIPTACQVGETIWYQAAAGTEVTVDNTKHILVQEDAVLSRVFGDETPAT